MMQHYGRRLNRHRKANDEDLHRTSVYVHIAWFIVFCAALAASIYSVQICIREYNDATVVVSVSTPPQVSMRLPNIMLCYDGDLNGREMDKLDISHSLKHALAHGPFTIPPGHTIPISVIEEWKKAQEEMIVSSHFDFIRDHSFACNQLIVDSFIIVQRLDLCKNARLVFHPDYSSCLVIEDVGHQEYPGTAAGLQLLLRMPNASKADNYKGFIIEVFDPDLDFPPILADTYLGPRTDAALMVEMQIHKRLKSLSWPKGGNLCEPASSEHANTSCHYRCAAHSMEYYCGCVVQGIHYSKPDSRPCSLEEFNCLLLNGSLLVAKSHECNTKCLPPCEDKIFRRTISSRQLISDSNQSDTKITIAYGALQYLLIEESEAYTLLTLLSNIGGTLGLYLGFSLIACVDICTAYIRKRRRKVREGESKGESFV